MQIQEKNYDSDSAWSIPDPVTYCNGCGCELYEDDVIYDIDGGICEDCMNDRYRKEIRRIV